MNNKLKVLLYLLYGIIMFIAACFIFLPKNEETIVIKKSVWDSIQNLANKPPVIVRDTQYLPGEVKYVNLPLPEAKKDTADSTINYYADTLKNEEINVWVDLKIKGVLLDRQWWYRSITKQITTTTTIYVPKIIDNPIPVSQNGFYIYGTVGGNAGNFLFGGGLDYITKKDYEVGYMYQRFGSLNIHSFKAGVKIGSTRKQKPE